MYQQLKEFGHVKVNEPMSRHTTFKIGGPVDFFVIVHGTNGRGPTNDTNNLVGLLKYLDGEGVPYFIIGGGSNMLVRDEGFRGVAIQIRNHKSEIINQIVEAEAGCITVDIAQKSMKAGLTGFEWGVGVPGTIGGAIRGNAGAMGGEMKDVVSEVEVYRNGEITKLGNEECTFAYRDCIFKHNGGVVLRVWLKLQKSENKELMKKAMEHLQYRMKTQPQGHSIGCIFKNFEIKKQDTSSKIQTNSNIPDEFIQKGRIPAGWLVDQAGMKGAQVGAAKMSDKHGNFILNLGSATAQDVLTLVAQIKERVYDKFGVELEEEIQII